jgi:amino acid permease
MGSVGVITVWQCNCLAYIRFHHSLRAHRDALGRLGIPKADRDGIDYPYRSFGQPHLAYIGFVGCLFVVLASNSSLLWNGFQLEAFLSSYLFVSLFLSEATDGEFLLTWMYTAVNSVSPFVDSLEDIPARQMASGGLVKPRQVCEDDARST